MVSKGLLEPVSGPHLCPLHGYLKMIVKPSWYCRFYPKFPPSFQGRIRTLEPPAWGSIMPLYNRHREAPVLLQLVAGPTCRGGKALKQAHLRVKSSVLYPFTLLKVCFMPLGCSFGCPHPVSLYSLYHVDLSRSPL